jgi:predicted alpha-1,2-mannosidase
MSHGNTLPLVGAPWGMTDWSPQTGGGEWFFQYSGKKIEGFRATRQPSPWMGDYAQLVMMPETGALEIGEKNRASEYDVDAGVWKPNYVKVELQRYHITTELTATERCGMFRLTFAQGDEGHLLFFTRGKSEVQVTGRTARIYSQPEDFGAYYVVELDRDITGAGTFEGGKINDGQQNLKGTNVGTYLNFKTAGGPVEVKIGTSYISYEQAEENLRQEIGKSNFQTVRAKTAAVWEKQLSRLEIENGSEDQLKTFYTCLYRASKFPHRIYELNASGKPIHRSPYDGKIQDGVLYADNGFWDTYRTEYALYSVVYPEQWREMMLGWVQAFRENGWYPQWPSPGNRSCMIGTHIDAVIADAIVKGVDGLDLETAYAGLHKDAFTPPNSDVVGRQALGDYLKRGYVPDGHCAYAMSSSLDYAYDDWCVAQAAKKLGKLDDYATLMERAKNYTKSWDPSIGFMRARKDNGDWVDNFDEFAWGGPYVEGGPWQCSWAVQQDVAGLIKLVGGPDAMIAKLDKMLTMPATFHPGGYGGVIHEMSEMPPCHMGQYSHNNQPVHHVLYLFTAAGQPWKTEFWTRKVCATLYNSGPEGFAGDEDNGEMASWYVLNALGFYPLTPGRPEYVLTTPVFTKATIHLASGKKFVITAPDNNDQTCYTTRRILNGKPLATTWINHADIVKGGKLAVTVSEKPAIRELPLSDLPYSMSTDVSAEHK